MPKLKRLSGKEIVKIFLSFGFIVEKTRGSHVKLTRNTQVAKQVLGVPLHAELDKGTQKAIYTQALRYISETEIRIHFYTDYT